MQLFFFHFFSLYLQTVYLSDCQSWEVFHLKHFFPTEGRWCIHTIHIHYYWKCEDVFLFVVIKYLKKTFLEMKLNVCTCLHLPRTIVNAHNSQVSRVQCRFFHLVSDISSTIFLSTSLISPQTAMSILCRLSSLSPSEIYLFPRPPILSHNLT